MSILFDHVDRWWSGPVMPALRAPLLATSTQDDPSRPPGASSSRAQALVEAAAAAFALGHSTEARRLLSEAAAPLGAVATQTVSLVLLATFAGHDPARRPHPRERATVATTLVAWGQPLAAFAVLLDGRPDPTLTQAARSLAASRPSDCGLAAVVALHERRFSSALQLLNEASRLAEGAGQHGVLAHLKTLIGELSVQLGSPGPARQALAAAIELSVRTRQPSWAARAAVAEATRSVVIESPSRDQRVRQAYRLALTTSPGTCDRAELLQATALAAEGRWTDAFDLLSRLARRDPRDLTHLLPAGLLSLLADAATHSGHQVEARTLVSRIAAVDMHCECDIELAELLYATAVLSDGAIAETCFKVALSLNAHRLPWHHARTSLAYGGWLRRSRRVAESRSHLLVALRIFEALDLPPWARRAQGELRASGVRTAGDTVRSDRPLGLSPQELQIAHLVARGLTNREIGETLHLSPRTVGSHLYRIFPKLDVTSRGQLATLLR